MAAPDSPPTDADALRVVVVGCGNIGLRHVRNLVSLGADVTVVDHDAAAVARGMEAGGSRSASLDEALATNPSAVVVATPTAFHVEPAVAALEAGVPVFVEKPLAHDEAGVAAVVAAAEAAGVPTMVACNMRFHGGPRTIRRLLDEGAVGEVVSVLFDLGQYLPDWHPDQDYRASYSARAGLGGGIVLDAVHEVDVAIDWFGAPRDVFCHGGTRSGLELDTEDVADALLRWPSGLVVNVHMDYVQRTYCRRYKVVGTEGTIEWGLPGPVRVYRATTGSWEEHPVPEEDTRAMYVRELEHFLSCVASGEPTVCPVSAGALAARAVLGARASMASGALVPLAPWVPA